MKQFLSTLLVLILASHLYAEGEQPAENKSTAAPQEETTEQAEARKKARRKEIYETTKDLQVLPTPDPLLKVKNINYLRNYASSGRGEFLNISFDLDYTGQETKEYLVYVLALNEEIAEVPYESKWRSKDPQKNIKLIRFQKLSPEPIEPKAVLGEKSAQDYDNLKMASILNNTLNREFEPTLEQYVDYLTKNPDKALKVKVYGDEAPAPAESNLSNIEVKQDERDRDVNYATDNHTYSILASKFKTVVTTHHFSKYRNDFRFFNKVVVLVFDPSRPNQKLIHRSIQSIKKPKVK
ncbi:MAG: hypothetical protein H7A24_07110 [Leptospiraceae bacterium]|nr:hypothetical protein [Leptospiraceae bacterium]MCP5511633.1 hypothetical protein [Leptospiraceae bacterium]